MYSICIIGMSSSTSFTTYSQVFRNLNYVIILLWATRLGVQVTVQVMDALTALIKSLSHLDQLVSVPSAISELQEIFIDGFNGRHERWITLLGWLLDLLNSRCTNIPHSTRKGKKKKDRFSTNCFQYYSKDVPPPPTSAALPVYLVLMKLRSLI